MIAYTREGLMMYRAGGAPPAGIPVELRRQRRGTRAGTKARLRRETHRRFKPCLPSIVMGTVRSLANKTDKLTALARHSPARPDCAIELAGFTLARAYRGQQSSKRKGGGLSVFVNTKWCKPWTCYRQREHLYSRYRTVSCGSEAIPSASGVLSRHCCCCVCTTVCSGGERLCRHPLYRRETTDSAPHSSHDNQDFDHVSLSKTLTRFTQCVK